ncbi:zinc finger, CCHC-type containing protein, partial [Tanacetum coccineum]
MDCAAMKHMTLNFAKLDKFEGVDFTRWHKKMHFLLSSISVVYVLTTPNPEDSDNDDYICRGLILKAFMSTSKLNDSVLLHAKLGNVHFKKVQGMSKDGLISTFDMDIKRIPNKWNKINPYELWTKRKLNLNYLRVWDCRAVVRLPNLKLKTLGERGIECIFVGYAEHSKAFRFSSVPRPSQRSLINRNEDIGGLVVPEEVVTQQPKPDLRKGKGIGLQRKAINDEMDSIMGNNTWVLDDLPPGCKSLGYKWIFKRKLKMGVKTTFLNGELDEEFYMNQPQGFIMHGNENKVDLTKEFLSSKFSKKDMGEADVILGIRIKHKSNGISISQSHYIGNVLKKFNYFDCTPVSTPMDTSEKLMPNNVGKLSSVGNASWISNTEDNSSTSGWVIMLGGGTISWAPKKQTCITGSTMKYEFVALAATCMESEWLRNLILEIPLWSKPIAPISILCNSAAILAKAYSQMYNWKSRQLGVVHTMIHELITNGVPITPAPATGSPNNEEDWNALYDVHNEAACIMLGSMSPKLQMQFENYAPYDMLQELKSMFEKQAKVE